MRVHVKIFGKVQGVFFRKSAKVEADQLSLVGWVRNRSDGSVEVMAQGEKDSVEKFTKWCKKGPPFAKVENLEVDWREDEQDLDEFSII